MSSLRRVSLGIIHPFHLLVCEFYAVDIPVVVLDFLIEVNVRKQLGVSLLGKPKKSHGSVGSRSIAAVGAERHLIDGLVLYGLY